MDEIDFGSERQTELNIELVRRQAAKGGLLFKGRCYNPSCEEPLKERNFCNAKCRDEYDKFIKRGR